MGLSKAIFHYYIFYSTKQSYVWQLQLTATNNSKLQLNCYCAANCIAVI